MSLIKMVEEMILKGHAPILNGDHSVNIWVKNVGFHNGPGCQKCGHSWCEHCWHGSPIYPRETIEECPIKEK